MHTDILTDVMSNYSRSWTACAVIISSFIHSKAVVTRVKSLENDRQGRSRREYSVPETAVWPKMFHVNRQRRHGQRLLLYLARLFKFRSRPHRSGCAFHSLSSFLFFTNGDRSVRRVFFSAVQPPHKNGVGTLWPDRNSKRLIFFVLSYEN